MSQKLVVGMLIKNEVDRYLKSVIENINNFADELVILDDNSTDGSVELVKSTSEIPVHVTRVGNKGNFGNEIVLRKLLYELVLSYSPDWYMIIDADEIYDGASRNRFEKLMNQNDTDAWGFKLFDMWNEKQYREDKLWGAHHFYSIMLIRNVKTFIPEWNEQPHHCGRIPRNVWSLKVSNSDLMNIKHFGWAKEEFRKAKFDRYMKHDGDGKYGSLEQYRSILDENPNLIDYKNIKLENQED